MQEKIKIKLKIKETIALLAKLKGVLKGTINEIELGDKKKSNEKIVRYILTYKGEGNKTKSVYVEKSRVAEVKKMIDNYQEAKNALEQLVELNVQLFKIT